MQGLAPLWGSIWPPPLIFGWAALAAGSQGFPAEGGGLGLRHYDYCLSFLCPPLHRGSPSYDPIRSGTGIFITVSYHHPITRPPPRVIYGPDGVIY